MKLNTDGKFRLDSFSENDLKIMVTGDLCPIADAADKLIAGKGELLFGDVLPELRNKDLSITNLELTLSKNGSPIDKCGPNIKVDPAIMPGLGISEFDVYGVANNHTRDFGDDAFMETLSHIADSGAHYVGGGKNAADASKPVLLEMKGRKIAIFALSMHCDCDAGTDTPGVNVLNLPYNTIDIMKARQDGYFVIVIFHDGKEFIPFPSSRIRNYCRAFVDAGACAVIGHHPHIGRGMEIYNGSLIAYSLGNFLFPTHPGDPKLAQPSWFQAYSLRLYLGEHDISGFDFIPHKYDIAKQRMEVLKGDEREDYFHFVNKLNEILKISGENERYFSAAAAEVDRYYQPVINYCNDILHGNDDPLKKRQNAKWFYHFLTCDEHWDTLKATSYHEWKSL